MTDGKALADAARSYFNFADANKPPQTREQFEYACALSSFARDRLREVLEDYEREHP